MRHDIFRILFHSLLFIVWQKNFLLCEKRIAKWKPNLCQSIPNEIKTLLYVPFLFDLTIKLNPITCACDFPMIFYVIFLFFFCFFFCAFYYRVRPLTVSHAYSNKSILNLVKLNQFRMKLHISPIDLEAENGIPFASKSIAKEKCNYNQNLVQFKNISI